MYKKCKKCLLVKCVLEFGPDKRAKDGLKNWCRPCVNIDYNSRYENIKVNKLATCKKRYEAKKDVITKQVKRYYYENKEAALIRRAKYYDKNKQVISQKNKQYRQDNKEKLKIIRAEYVKNNLEIVRLASLNWVNKKLRTDPEYRLKNNMRLLLRGFLRDSRVRTSKKLGFNHFQLLQSLGRYPEFGEQIDHKIPVSWFSDMTIPHIINDLRNLQILSAKENSVKNNKHCHPVSIEYFELIKPYIKQKYLTKIKFYGK